MSLMVVCSISTFMFNANPLMRFDGYYVLADWLEIPNLRDRSNRFLKQLAQEYCLGIEVQPEPYMTLTRRSLFVTYAITSYIYRWVVTFSILIFLDKFLQPYNLHAVSRLLAFAAAASMVGWPLYRMGKAIYKRGRLPDMKSNRVTVTVCAVVLVIAVFCFLPLPVSRVRQTALVMPQTAYIHKVTVPNVEGGAILEKLFVKDGQPVKKGQVLAIFRSLELENRLSDAESQVATREVQMRTLTKQRNDTTDPQEKNKIESSIATAQGELDTYDKFAREYREMERKLVLRSDWNGVVMSCPRVDDVGKQWDKENAKEFCSIGDPHHLQALMPVPPDQYRLLQEELDEDPNLEVTIRVQGQAETTWKGRIAHLAASEAKEVPPQLSTKFGGPLAVKPSSQQNSYVPQSQHYMVNVDFLESDDSIHSGTLAKVKVHCRWRSAAWWVWRKISSTFDLALL